MKHIYFTCFDSKIFLKHVIWVSFANNLFPPFFSCMKILSSTSLFKHAIIFRIQSRDTNLDQKEPETMRIIHPNPWNAFHRRSLQKMSCWNTEALCCFHLCHYLSSCHLQKNAHTVRRHYISLYMDSASAHMFSTWRRWQHVELEAFITKFQTTT